VYQEAARVPAERRSATAQLVAIPDVAGQDERHTKMCFQVTDTSGFTAGHDLLQASGQRMRAIVKRLDQDLPRFRRHGGHLSSLLRVRGQARFYRALAE
jgi:hypothetical protein